MPRWRKSSRCSGPGECVEVAVATKRVLVRDSKDPDGPVIAVSATAWRAFVAHLKQVS